MWPFDVCQWGRAEGENGTPVPVLVPLLLSPSTLAYSYLPREKSHLGLKEAHPFPLPILAQVCPQPHPGGNQRHQRESNLFPELFLPKLPRPSCWGVHLVVLFCGE
jgi:hypothetical protein